LICGQFIIMRCFLQIYRNTYAILQTKGIIVSRSSKSSISSEFPLFGSIARVDRSFDARSVIDCRAEKLKDRDSAISTDLCCRLLFTCVCAWFAGGSFSGLISREGNGIKVSPQK
jgi:hypothetical protein